MKNQKRDEHESRENPENVVFSKLVDDRAVELLNKPRLKYPEVYRVLVNELYKAIKNGLLNSIDGTGIYGIIKILGLDIEPDIRLRFIKRGKEVDLKDYLS